MTNFIPIFPLNVVVYPNEKLNLHIFEPKYKQLIKECIEEGKDFGIPVVINKKIQEFGVLIKVKELVKEYETGEMDIRTSGQKVFKVLEVVKDIPDKLYSGAIVNYPDNILENDDTKISQVIFDEVKKLYKLLNVEEKLPQDGVLFKSYDIAHFIGLTQEQEYELLTILKEVQRLEYIRRHLNNIIPVIDELEQLKARVKLNGHFKSLSLDDLDF